MKAEYETANLIKVVDSYIEKTGTWPKSEKELQYDISGKVYINYSLSTQDILKDPSLLKKSLKPKSEVFYTYPHYQRDLDNLFKTIKKKSAEQGDREEFKKP